MLQKLEVSEAAVMETLKNLGLAGRMVSGMDSRTGLSESVPMKAEARQKWMASEMGLGRTPRQPLHSLPPLLGSARPVSSA